ncbi:MAG: TlpA disulfide reductase family protein [Thermodesulfobacteriota bacterium]
MRNPLYLLIALCSLIFIVSCERGETKTTSSGELQDAKTFSLPSLNGQGDVALSDFNGKPLVINFWASWCAPCRREIPFFENTWKDYKDKGVVFIGIDVMDEKSVAQKFIEAFDITYVILHDPSGEVSNEYGVVALPATFFVDKQGKIIKKNYGPFLGEDGEKTFMKYLKEISD